MRTMDRALAFLYLIIGGVAGFNIATKGFQIIQGPNNSFFGYSLDFIQQQSTTWLLIGAPQLSDADGNVTGGVFKRDASASNQSPELVDILGDVSTKGKDIPTGDKREMWLGASMATSDNTATVCAPRWKNAINDSELYMNGLCYVFPSGFLNPTISKFLEVTPRRLLVSYPDKQHISPDPSRYNMEWEYGLGAAGMSVIYDKSSQISVSGDYTLYGAPGVNEFTGALLFKGSSSNASVFDQALTQSKESKMYGMSLAMGKFYGDGVFYTAMGGPRAMGTGQVLILNTNYTIKENITGSEPGSYFGASLCAVKRRTNSEEYLLLVGAPLYSSMTMYDKFYTSVVEKGAVFVYRLTSGTEPIQMLSSSTEAGSRFGSAMADLGDVNKDGFNDVVIGAPFEEGGTGVIYVYNGYTQGFMETQKVVGKDLDASLIGQFGCAFSQNNIDVSGDNSVDVAVGSYGTSTAVILFTRPSISMKVSARQSTQLTDPGATDFYISACFQYSGGPEIPSSVLLDYRISVDTHFSGESKRVCVVNEQGSCQDEVVEKERGIEKNLFDPKCLKNFTVKVLEMKEARELFIPIVFSIQYNISNISCSEAVCPLINRFYGNMEDPMATEVEAIKVNFRKPGCDSDNICQTDVSLQVSEPRYFINPGSSVLVLGPKSGFTIDITLSVRGEPAYNTKLKITCREPLSYVQTVQILGKEMKCSVINSESGVSSIECDTNPSQLGLQNETIQMQMEFDARNLRMDQTSFKFIVQTTTKSNDTDMTNNIKELVIQKELIVEKDFEMSVQPDIYLTKEDAAQLDLVNMTHGITFFNRGPSNVDGEALFTIKFPTARVGNKWILNITEAMVNISNAQPDTSVSCDVNVTDISNTTDIRQTYKALNLATVDAGKGDTIAQYDCRKEGSCTTIKCKVQPIQAYSHVHVTLKFMFDPQLFERVTGQDSDVQSVDLVSVVYVELPKNVKQKLLQNDNYAKTEILPPLKSIPPYIIALAVIGAVLIIIFAFIIVCLCRKYGFFKRKHRDLLKQLQQESNTTEQESEKEKEGLEKPEFHSDLTTPDSMNRKDSKAYEEVITMPDAEDSQDNKGDDKEDWNDVDDMLKDLNPASSEENLISAASLEDVKIETRTDVENENKTENGHTYTNTIL